MRYPRLVIQSARPVPMAQLEALSAAINEWQQGRKQVLVLPADMTPIWEPTPLRRRPYYPSSVAHKVK
jgi:hypothetical protein